LVGKRLYSVICCVWLPGATDFKHLNSSRYIDDPSPVTAVEQTCMEQCMGITET
jgi:hypothetical protein